MKKIGIIIAMQKEWDSIFADTEFTGCGFVAKGRTKRNIPYVVMVSGIGKVNAAVCAYKLWKEYDVTEILSFGCAGGMTNDVSVGDVVIGDSYCYHDAWCGEPNERGRVQGEPMYYPSNWKEWEWLYEGCKPGLVATGDALCDSELMACAIVQIIGKNPIAVDMESAAIAQVCNKYHVPFTSIRVISDNPLLGRHADEYRDFWKQKNEILSGLFRRFLEKD